MSLKNWPCPNECVNWCRVGPIKSPIPNHHPNCEYYNDSLIDIWIVSLDGSGYYTDIEPNMEDLDDGVLVSKTKIHQECYDQMKEFNGF